MFVRCDVLGDDNRAACVLRRLVRAKGPQRVMHPQYQSNHDDNSSEYDNENDWKYHDGKILGEEWLLDEYHGIHTDNTIDVEC